MSRRKTADSELATTEITGGGASPNAPTDSEAAAEPSSTSAAELGEDDATGSREHPPTTPPPVPDDEPQPAAPVVQPAVFAKSVRPKASIPPSPFGDPALHIALAVSSLRPKGFCRAGRKFGPEPTVLMPWDVDALGPAQVEALEAEPALKSRRLTWADLSDAQRADVLARII